MTTKHKVISSNIQYIGHYPTKWELIIEFKSGKIYKYESIGKGLFKDLLDAPSKGEFFNTNIKDRFPCTLIADWPGSEFTGKQAEFTRRLNKLVFANGPGNWF